MITTTAFYAHYIRTRGFFCLIWHFSSYPGRDRFGKESCSPQLTMEGSHCAHCRFAVTVYDASFSIHRSPFFDCMIFCDKVGHEMCGNGKALEGIREVIIIPDMVEHLLSSLRGLYTTKRNGFLRLVNVATFIKQLFVFVNLNT